MSSKKIIIYTIIGIVFGFSFILGAQWLGPGPEYGPGETYYSEVINFGILVIIVSLSIGFIAIIRTKKKKASMKKPKVNIEEPAIDQKKRLYGMIKLRREIDLEEATEFLKISRRDLEGLLYDLAGDNIIQGKFEKDKFLIESDVDNFLNVLDNSFQQWSDNRSKKQ